ncbi:MAG: hypothetical protein KC503_21040 [Myxococcales bacterium]|nr:hypothetical protein [Myxococcales bacterium]
MTVHRLHAVAILIGGAIAVAGCRHEVGAVSVDGIAPIYDLAADAHGDAARDTGDADSALEAAALDVLDGSGAALVVEPPAKGRLDCNVGYVAIAGGGNCGAAQIRATMPKDGTLGQQWTLSCTASAAPTETWVVCAKLPAPITVTPSASPSGPTASAACATGVLVGTAGTCGSFGMIGHKPDSRGAFVTCSGGQAAQAFAICASGPLDARPPVTGTGVQTNSCSTGRRVVGGGCELASSATNTLTKSYPTGSGDSGWVCDVAGSQPVQVWAFCAP